jgi:hypothetical protein
MNVMGNPTAKTGESVMRYSRIYGIMGVLLCMLVLVACGKVAMKPAHPLIDNTPSTGSKPTTTTTEASVNTNIQPIQVTSDTTSLTTYPGGQMSLTISTSPGANCIFIVNYGKNEASKNIGVVPHTANANGSVTWNWYVDGNAHTGTWPLTLYATMPGGARTTKQVMVSVVLPPINVIASQSTLSANRDASMTLTLSTGPDMRCVLTLTGGPTKAVKYLKNASDSNGAVSWTWHVGKDAATGTWPLTITVTLQDGETTSTTVNSTIL